MNPPSKHKVHPFWYWALGSAAIHTGAAVGLFAFGSFEPPQAQVEQGVYAMDSVLIPYVPPRPEPEPVEVEEPLPEPEVEEVAEAEALEPVIPEKVVSAETEEADEIEPLPELEEEPLVEEIAEAELAQLAPGAESDPVEEYIEEIERQREEIVELEEPEEIEQPIAPTPELVGGESIEEPVVLRNPTPLIPMRLRAQVMSSETVLRIRIAPTGDVIAAEVAQSAGHPELDRRARAIVLKSWKFEPARRSGLPIEFDREIEFAWRVQ